MPFILVKKYPTINQALHYSVCLSKREIIISRQDPQVRQTSRLQLVCLHPCVVYRRNLCP